MITFTADRNSLATAISRAVQGVPPRPVRPVYAGMLITLTSGRAALTTSDSQVTFRTRVDGAASDKGSFILPAKVLQEVSRYWTGKEVTIAFGIKPGVAEITAGRSSFTLSVLDGEEFPLENLDPPGYLGALDGSDLAVAIKRVIPAASDTDPVLQAVNLVDRDGKLYVMATDRWRLALMTPLFDLFQGPERERAPESVLIAASVLDRFSRVIPKDQESRVGIGWNDKLAILSSGETEMIAPTIAGQYQKWEPIVALKLATAATVDTAELTRAVRMAMVAAGDEGTVELTFDHADLYVKAQGSHAAADLLETDYTGDEVTFLLSARKLLEGLSACGEKAELAFRGSNAVFITSDGGYRYMIQARRNVNINVTEVP